MLAKVLGGRKVRAAGEGCREASPAALGRRALQEEQRPGAARSRGGKGPMSLEGPGRRLVDEARAAE